MTKETKLEKEKRKEFMRGYEFGKKEGKEEYKKMLQEIFGIEKCHCDSCNNY